MRRIIILSTFVVCLMLVAPAEAQLRGDALTETAPALVYGAGGPGFSLSSLFRPGTFRMQHAVEMSVGSYGGQTSSLGMYTNSLIWNFGPKLAARADISLAYSPYGDQLSGRPGSVTGGGRVFLRNAEIAYRPRENMLLHLSVQQSPYGRYLSPYGYRYNPFYGYRPY